MSADEPRPFLASQRRDVLASLSEAYIRGAHVSVVEKVAAALDPEQIKLDGKGGSLDGALSSPGDVASPGFAPICGAYPGPPVKLKEGKDGGEKGGKEQKDSKEGKEGKEAKDGKEDKDSSDGFKLGGDEVSNPVFRWGDVEQLPAEAFNEIAQAHVERVELSVERGSIL
jgi:hypothetical protein